MVTNSRVGRESWSHFAWNGAAMWSVQVFSAARGLSSKLRYLKPAKSSPHLLFGRQASMLAGYHYLVSDSAGHPIGELEWPNLAQARNASMKWHGNNREAGSVKIQYEGQSFFVEFEYLSRGWVNDTRYFLIARGQTEPHATAQLKFRPTGKKRGLITLEHPLAAGIVRLSRWPRQRFSLEVDGREIGVIEDRKWLSLVREMSIDLPTYVDRPTQLFVFFLVCHLLQTQA